MIPVLAHSRWATVRNVGGTIRRGYDLTLHMMAVSPGQLGRECAEWRSD